MISVVIPCFNDHSLLAHTIRSLEKQSDSGLFEVIIVDSSVNSFHYAGPLVTQYLHPNARLYAGLARNLGVKVSSGDVLVFLDSKVMPEKTALKKDR